MLIKIATIIFVGSGALCAQQNLSSFTQRVDELSHQLVLTIEKSTLVDDDYSRSIANYTLHSKNNYMTLNVVERCPGAKTKERLAQKTEGLSFIANEVEVRFGKEMIARFEQFEHTRAALERIKNLVAESERLRVLKATQDILHRIKQLKNESDNIFREGKDNRRLADGKINYMISDGSGLNVPTKHLEFDNHHFEAINPPSPSGMHLPMGRNEARSFDGRRYGTNLLELREAGLIEPQPLHALRNALWGLPIDYWTKAGAATLPSTVELVRGAVMPPVVVGGKPVVLGRDVMISSYSPEFAKSESTSALLDTFLIPRTYKSVVNPHNEYERLSTSNWSFSRSEMDLFPSAGLHEDGRLFISGWVALAAHQGLLVFVQYEDEPRPRMAVFDPSGIVIKLDWGEVSYGCASTLDRSTGKAKYTPQLSRRKPEAEFVYQEIGRTHLETEPTGSVLALEGKGTSSHVEMKLVLPRSLW